MLVSSLVTVTLAFDNVKECEEVKKQYEQKGWNICSYGSTGDTWYFQAEIEED